MADNKLIKILKKIEDEYYSWKEIQDFCNKIGISHQYVWNIIMDKDGQLVDDQAFREKEALVTKYRLNIRGKEYLQRQEERGSWKPTKKEFVSYVITFSLGIIATVITLYLTNMLGCP